MAPLPPFGRGSGAGASAAGPPSDTSSVSSVGSYSDSGSDSEGGGGSGAVRAGEATAALYPTALRAYKEYSEREKARGNRELPGLDVVCEAIRKAAAAPGASRGDLPGHVLRDGLRGIDTFYAKLAFTSQAQHETRQGADAPERRAPRRRGPGGEDPSGEAASGPGREPPAAAREEPGRHAAGADTPTGERAEAEQRKERPKAAPAKPRKAPAPESQPRKSAQPKQPPPRVPQQEQRARPQPPPQPQRQEEARRPKAKREPAAKPPQVQTADELCDQARAIATADRRHVEALEAARTEKVETVLRDEIGRPLACSVCRLQFCAGDKDTQGRFEFQCSAGCTITLHETCLQKLKKQLPRNVAIASWGSPCLSCGPGNVEPENCSGRCERAWFPVSKTVLVDREKEIEKLSAKRSRKAKARPVPQEARADELAQQQQEQGAASGDDDAPDGGVEEATPPAEPTKKVAARKAQPKPSRPAEDDDERDVDFTVRVPKDKQNGARVQPSSEAKGRRKKTKASAVKVLFSTKSERGASGDPTPWLSPSVEVSQPPPPPPPDQTEFPSLGASAAPADVNVNGSKHQADLDASGEPQSSTGEVAPTRVLQPPSKTLNLNAQTFVPRSMAASGAAPRDLPVPAGVPMMLPQYTHAEVVRTNRATLVQYSQMPAFGLRRDDLAQPFLLEMVSGALLLYDLESHSLHGVFCPDVNAPPIKGMVRFTKAAIHGAMIQRDVLLHVAPRIISHFLTHTETLKLTMGEIAAVMETFTSAHSATAFPHLFPKPQ